MKRILGCIVLMFMIVACSSPPTPTITDDIANYSDAELEAMTDIELQSLYGYQDRNYEITIENLTEGQPFSPGVIATHYRRKVLFKRGRTASEGIRAIAENGDPSVSVGELEGQPGIAQVFATNAPVFPVNGTGSSTLTTTFTASDFAWRFSLATMLICTNDGFTGLDARWLPFSFHERSYYAYAYDAGTEENTEKFTDIVDPCGAIGPIAAAPDGMNNRPATSGVVNFHPNIQGGADLDPKAHGWQGPVAKITVKRIRPPEPERVYKVTVENRTSSQPMSPGAFATHSRDVRFFKRGQKASEGIRLIAENGDPSTAVTELSSVSEVYEAKASGAPAFIGGDPVSVEITAGADATRLSLALMLICTNDGFVGLDSVRLPSSFHPVTYYARGYDAGTEKNDELYGSIVPPCFGIGPEVVEGAGGTDRTPTDDVIRRHRKIKGVGDLERSLYTWREPAAKVTIERIK